MNPSERGEFRKFSFWLAQAAVLLFLAILCSRSVGTEVKALTGHNSLLTGQRVKEALDYLEAGASPDSDKIIFVGSSDVEVGISPREIEAAVPGWRPGETEILNFGFRNFTSSLYEPLARRIGEIARARHLRIRAIFVAFAPLRATKKFVRDQSANALVHFDDVEAELYSRSMLLREFRKSPGHAAKIAFIKYALNSRSGDSLGSVIADDLLDRLRTATTNPSEIDRKHDTFARLLWAPDGIFSPEPVWDPREGGHIFFGYPATRDQLEPILSFLRQPAVLQDHIEMWTERAGLLDWDFDEPSLRHYVSSLIAFRRIADEAFFFYLPCYPAIQRTAEADARLQAALTAVAQEAAVSVVDVRDLRPGLTADDYFDVVHLTLSGQAKAAAMLAPVIQSVLDPR